MLNSEDVRKAVQPLRLIFWGVLICVLDFRINGFDLINDAVGAVMIARGVFLLGGIGVDEQYRAAMGFLRPVVVLTVIVSVVTQIPTHWPAVVSVLLGLFGLVQMVALIVFCVAMRRFCEAAELVGPAQSWRTSTALFVVIYVVPLGLLHVASIVASIGGGPFHYQLGPWALVLVPVFLIPLIHLFISTSRMATGASEAGGT